MFKDAPAFSSFSVNDIAKAKDFYAKVLGLSVSEDSGMLQIKLSGGGQIMVYPKPDHAPASFTVLNFNVNDIEQAVAHLKTNGAKFETYDEPQMRTDANNILTDDHMKMKIAWFKDPAGNILSVIEGEMS